MGTESEDHLYVPVNDLYSNSRSCCRLGHRRRRGGQPALGWGSLRGGFDEGATPTHRFHQRATARARARVPRQEVPLVDGAQPDSLRPEAVRGPGEDMVPEQEGEMEKSQSGVSMMNIRIPEGNFFHWNFNNFLKSLKIEEKKLTSDEANPNCLSSAGWAPARTKASRAPSRRASSSSRSQSTWTDSPWGASTSSSREPWETSPEGFWPATRRSGPAWTCTDSTPRRRPTETASEGAGEDAYAAGVWA